MNNLFLITTIILISIFLPGCNSKKDSEVVKEYMISSEKSLPENFTQSASENRSVPNSLYLVKKASTEIENEKLWKDFGLKKQVPEIDFTNSNTYFIGVTESSSCPVKIENIKIGTKKMKITLSSPSRACTSDLVPRTFVIKVPKEISDIKLSSKYRRSISILLEEHNPELRK